jgi:hypothetical protein
MDLALRTFFRLPIIGWLVRDAVHGAPDAKYYFMANLLLAFVLLLYEFGYPFLISFALTAAAIALISRRSHGGRPVRGTKQRDRTGGCGGPEEATTLTFEDGVVRPA